MFSDEEFIVQTKLWIWKGEAVASWHFITIEKEIADRIKFFAPLRGGFGSVKIKAKINTTTWKTSLFPHKESGGFILPIKKEVRLSENLKEGDDLEIILQIAD